MRKLFTVVVAATLMAFGSVGAQAWQGSNGHAIGTATQNLSPVKPAACRGPGPFCPPGFVRACGPFRCWCRPCY
jgi:hypothetical protein